MYQVAINSMDRSPLHAGLLHASEVNVTKNGPKNRRLPGELRKMG
jgi:hypothetical protein